MNTTPNTPQTNNPNYPNVPAAHQEKKGVKEFLESDIVLKRIVEAYGSTETGKKAISSVLMEVTKNEDLRNCTKESILQCIIDSANFGLIPNKLSGHAYLIPYKGVATLQIGYKGYIKKFDEVGWNVEVEAVTKKEVEQGRFKELRGTTTLIEHYPLRDEIQTEENIALCYAIAKKPGREPIVAVMSLGTILEAAKSQIGWEPGKQGVKKMGLKGVWVSGDRDTDLAEQCKKTVLRRLSKISPIEITNIMSSYEGERDNYKDVTPVKENREIDPLRAKLNERKGITNQPTEKLDMTGGNVDNKEDPKSGDEIISVNRVDEPKEKVTVEKGKAKTEKKSKAELAYEENRLTPKGAGKITFHQTTGDLPVFPRVIIEGVEFPKDFNYLPDAFKCLKTVISNQEGVEKKQSIFDENQKLIEAITEVNPDMVNQLKELIR